MSFTGGVMYQTAESSLHSGTAGYPSDYIIKLTDHGHGQASVQPPQAMSWHSPQSVFGRCGQTEETRRSS